MTAEATTDIRQGPWQQALSDVASVDCIICDLPYSERTHSGHDLAVAADRLAGEQSRVRVVRRTGAVYSVGVNRRKQLGYAYLTPEDLRAFVEHWHPRCRGWFVAITDHQSARLWEDALEAAGRYVFAPLPWVATGSRVRLAGDGPSCWTCWIVVARPRCEPYSKWGTLPGAYIIKQERKTGAPITGTKPLALMRALVRDYSKPGDLIADPCAGTGTTLLAARSLGRDSIGAEANAETFKYAKRRLSLGWQPELFA